MNESQTVGDLVKSGQTKALKTLALFLSLIVYAGMLIYSFVHNYNLMSRGVPADMLMWAMLGVVSLELTAVGLPIALHWWTHANLQRYAALMFYVVDLGLMFANVVLNFALTAGSDVPEWLALYLQYVMPATPVVAGVGWTLLWLLDPSHRAEQSREGLREATREQITDRMAQAARGEAVNAMVDQAAQTYAWSIIQQTIGADPRLLHSSQAPLMLPSGNAIFADEPRRDGNRKCDMCHELWPADALEVDADIHTNMWLCPRCIREYRTNHNMPAFTPPAQAATAPTPPSARSRWHRPARKTAAPAEQPADIAAIVTALASLGIEPKAVKAFLESQAPAPTATFAADTDHLAPRPNGRGG